MARMRGSMAQQVLRLPVFGAGMPGRARLLAQLSPAARNWMLGPLLPTEWFDEKLAVELTRAVAQVLNLTTPDALQVWFRRQHIQGFAATLRAQGISSPEALLAGMPALWTRQHDTGSLTIEQQTPRSARIAIRNNPDVTDELYAVALAGGTEGFLTLAGAQGLRVTYSITRNALFIDAAWEATASVPDGAG